MGLRIKVGGFYAGSGLKVDRFGEVRETGFKVVTSPVMARVYESGDSEKLQRDIEALAQYVKASIESVEMELVSKKLTVD